MRMSPDVDEAARCSVSSCSCACYRPGHVQPRCCDGCGHGWVAHAAEKLQVRPPSACGPVEVALPGLVLDLSSLILYGAQAVPVRLKILLDRLYSVLTPQQVGHILHTLGWTLGDYVRGYMLQTPSGKVLDRWLMVTPEEELLVLTQFLRFGETRPIVELMTRPGFAAVTPQLNKSSRYVDQGGRPAGGEEPCPDLSAAPRYKSFADRLSLLRPVTSQGSEARCLAPPTEEPDASRPNPYLQRPSGTKLTQQNESVVPQPNGELAMKIKVDPDRPVAAQSLWSHRGTAGGPSLLRPASDSLHPPHPSPLPLPSFSSSFLCPSPTLQPLPSSLCSLPSSPAAGRKGRVCCGVCGKSFYDKGTLKIHYNAVHLKIKHGCTVAGCTMVFSSLRSRNRHSANPNPRLHTSSSRHTQTHRKSDTHEPKQPHDNTHVCRAAQLHRPQEDAHTRQRISPPPPPPLPLMLSQDLLLQTTPPLLLPARRGSSLGSPPSFVPLVAPKVEKPKAGCRLLSQTAAAAPSSDSTSITLTKCKDQHVSCENAAAESKRGDVCPVTSRWEPGASVPKKKPRKSSTPVKIEREHKAGETKNVEG